ncbi:MAG: hypothetical protein AAGI01_12480 [Myxococcota bacterium]
MTYEEFEWHILRFVYEDQLEKLAPSSLAYALGLPHDTVVDYLEQAERAGVVVMDFDEDGRLEYSVPGFDAVKPLPRPIWRKDDGFVSADAAEVVLDTDGADGGMAQAADEGDGADGSVRVSVPSRALPRQHGRAPEMPPALAAIIKDRYGDTDGSLVASNPVAVLDQAGIIDEPPSPLVQAPVSMAQATTALVPFEQTNHLMRVEAADEAFCDPTHTIFMRRLHVRGAPSEVELRYLIQEHFEKFGYRQLRSSSSTKLRFERGSVTFILALVPLFVLILPLFVYLFLYCMGRSTIQQEPLELEVSIEPSSEGPGCYTVDLTFIGQHGVVLGAADQRVLNNEIDTLRDELRWRLASST